MDSSIVIIVLCLVFSAFFSGMEIAFVSANKIHIEIEKKQAGFLAKVLTRLTKRPSKFIATMLIGNNIALVVYGLFMGEVLMNWFLGMHPENEIVRVFLTDFSLLTQTIISTLVILITAEFLPKVLFQIYANSLLKLLAIPAYLFYLAFSLVSDFVIYVSDFILKYIFRTSGDEVQLAFTKLELGDYITEQMETVEEADEVDSEIQIFQNALEFAEVKAREVMVPRTEITAVEIHETPKNLAKLFTETGYSKILVFKDTIDNVIGYVHSYELFKKPKTIKSILLPVEFVPETMLIQDILNVLIKKRKSIAVVLDEYGGTSGLMTVEDIVEELFGEIEDEHDTTDLKEEQIDERNYLFSARLEVDYINESYKLELPIGDEFETLGGLLVHQVGEIPEKDSEITIDHFKFIVLEVSNTKIDLVSLELLKED
ncbi:MULTISPECIES: hemolysin family protein [Maribacter]|uniref:Hemolysin family protein n=1 Tax=Maribacter flavus TaxID=1658664 RepID=A0ABU7IFT9_9FLAO|nr:MULTISPECIES: hemolysin family protein [Maribacter]MDC6405378.1 hemolysin family protein [Maribacter sp. PR66]MEE1971813.1 hemolysin family protein [Maribacter flavus]